MGVELVFDGCEREIPFGELMDFRDRFAEAAGVRNAGDGALVDLTVDALTNDYWQGSGIHTPVQWLVWRAGVSQATARRLVTVAARAGELPTTLGLLRAGRLSLDQAHAVARYTPAEYEQSVCNLAECATVSQIIAATRTYNFDLEAKEPHRRSERGVSFGFDDDGTWWARIRLAAEEGAIVEAALGKVRDELHDLEREAAKKIAADEGRPTNGTDTDLGVRPVGWADSLIGMANSILTNGAHGAGDRARNNVHLHLEAPHRGCGDEWIGELHGGTRLPEWLRQLLTCDADIDVIWTKDTVPVSVAKGQRTPPRWLRRLLERRDRYQCRVPGCGTTRWLQAHHIIHWENNGPTITSNLVMLCGRHHRMHHQGLLGITGNPDKPHGHPNGLVFTNQHGLVIEAAGKPTPPDNPGGSVPCGGDGFSGFQDLAGLIDHEPYAGPTGERLQKHWVHFNKTTPSELGKGAYSGPQRVPPDDASHGNNLTGLSDQDPPGLHNHDGPSGDPAAADSPAGADDRPAPSRREPAA